MCSVCRCVVPIYEGQKVCEDFFFHHTGRRNWIWVIKLGSKYLYVRSHISGPQSYSSNYTKQSNVFAINYILMIKSLKYIVTLQRHSKNAMQTFVVDPDFITDLFFRSHLWISLLKEGKDNLAVGMAQLVQYSMSRVGSSPRTHVCMCRAQRHTWSPGVGEMVQTDPKGVLASHPGLDVELQTNERPCLKNQSGLEGSWGMTLRVDLQIPYNGAHTATCTPAQTCIPPPCKKTNNKDRFTIKCVIIPSLLSPFLLAFLFCSSFLSSFFLSVVGSAVDQTLIRKSRCAFRQ